MFPNPFSRNNKIKQELEAAEKEVRNNLNALSALARDILLDSRYKGFAKLFEEAERNTIDLLLLYKESDPYKYKAKVDEFLIELGVYRNILNAVSDLSKEKSKENINLTQTFKRNMQGFINNL